jgi:lipoprotein NlpI
MTMIHCNPVVRVSIQWSLRIGLLAALPLLAVCAEDSATDATSDTYRAQLHLRLDNDIERLAAQIEKKPDSVDLYSRRGDLLFFRGRFVDAVSDFDRMIELAPDLETSHWRRGIAYFYAERYKDAARQFEIYHSFDNVDRENGIWRYLSQVKSVGKEEARKGLLKYEKDDREPFPDVYRLFAGKLTGEQVLEAIAVAKVAPEEREKRLFYAELYVGLNDFVDGRAESAEKHLRAAVRNRWGEKAGGGPGWMWQVGRVHYDLLRTARARNRKDRP